LVTLTDRYVSRQAVFPFLFGLGLYVCVIIIMNTMAHSSALANLRPGLDIVIRWMASQVPLIIVQTLPLAVLFAVLIAVGRLASDNELLSLQAGGVSIPRIALSLIVLAFITSAASLYLSEYVVPKANTATSRIWVDEIATQGGGLAVLARRPIYTGGYLIQFQGFDRATQQMTEFRLERWEGRQLTVMFAESAQFEGTGVELYGYRVARLDLATLPLTGRDDLEPGAAAEDALRRLVTTQLSSEDPQAALTVNLGITRGDLVGRFAGPAYNDPRSLSEAWRVMNDPNSPPAIRREAAVEAHTKLALPLANLILLLVGVPLAVGLGRNMSVAFGITLLVTVVYFIIIATGRFLGSTGALPVVPAVWSANLVFGAIGIYLLAGRGVRS
jgi:lipopolysaccharide export system permease protein